MNHFKIVNYSSSDDDEIIDSSVQLQSADTKLKYPAPNIQLTIKVTNESNNNNDSHEGRVRSFPHERGNWASYVYVSCPINDSMVELQNSFKNILKYSIGLELNFIEKSHISLSRTVVLQHHWIDIFKTSIIEQVKNVKSKTIDLNSLMFYSNDEKTRTFIGINITLESDMSYLNDLVRRMNICLDDFKLPLYYEIPSFHVSILWCLGDCVDQLNVLRPQLEAVFQNLRFENVYDFNLNIKEIFCKSGNKTFKFPLK